MAGRSSGGRLVKDESGNFSCDTSNPYDTNLADVSRQIHVIHYKYIRLG